MKTETRKPNERDKQNALYSLAVDMIARTIRQKTLYDKQGKLIVR